MPDALRNVAETHQASRRLRMDGWTAGADALRGGFKARWEKHAHPSPHADAKIKSVPHEAQQWMRRFCFDNIYGSRAGVRRKAHSRTLTTSVLSTLGCLFDWAAEMVGRGLPSGSPAAHGHRGSSY